LTTRRLEDSTTRVLIADDEPLARERVRELLKERRDIVIAGEARDGEEALRLAEKSSPDLLLLDIQMPGLDGFEVLAELDRERMPAVVFITAYDEYAVRAFEVQALDYVVKPFHRARFHEAVDRALARRGTAPQIAPKGPLSRFVVRSQDEIYFVKPADVTWIESSGNYVRLHTPAGEHVVRTAIRDLEERLDPNVFVRVHRSAIVNLDFIRKLEPYFHGEFVITLKDGSQLTSSRSYSGKLRELLKGYSL
jgi:two-component system, LytTR family, response regulator